MGRVLWMQKKVAIVQSNYIPWKGYFDLIRSVDEFILYDDAQYTARDWRNRNKIKTAQGVQWLTIPVEVKGKRCQSIRETKISDSKWGAKHWRAIEHAYAKAPFFKMFRGRFEALYLKNDRHLLSEINFMFLKEICQILSIKTKIRFSSDYRVDAKAEKTQKLADLCRQAAATHYISGPTAKDYLEIGPFNKENIEVSFFDYSGYPEYAQLFGPFVHEVSVLDLIFNTGEQALCHLTKN